MGLKSENVKPSWLQHLKDVSNETMEGKLMIKVVAQMNLWMVETMIKGPTHMNLWKV
jgi:hypothetical protein